jgi:hypothetical protein
LGEVTGDSVLQSRLADAGAQTGAAAAELSLALSSPSALGQIDLSALASVVQSGEASALKAEAAAAATRAELLRNVAVTSAATRQEVQSLSQDLFERKIFDAYLHFASPEDEADYRKREAAAHKYIDQQLAKNTPEGDLNAGGGMMGQMLDAHAHGAGDSPDFLPRWNALVEKTERQHAAMRAAGQSTEEYDRNLNASVRRFLKAKGLSDAEIDKRPAASNNPLDAVKPYLKNDKDSRDLEQKTQLSSHVEAVASPQSVTRAETADATMNSDVPLTINPDAMSTKLKAKGLQMPGDGETTGHGLSVQRPAAKTALEIGG